jgi:hypothetical protein
VVGRKEKNAKEKKERLNEGRKTRRKGVNDNE